MDIEATVTDNVESMKTVLEPTKKTGFGLLLKKARESAQLTEKEVAARLYLNSNLISIMENENFENAPPATFICGYLRSYARLLNIPEADIKMALKELGKKIPPQYAVQNTTLQAIPIKHHYDRYVNWISYLVIVVLVALVSMWWISHSRYPMITDSFTKLPPPSHVAVPPATAAVPPPATVMNANATPQPVAAPTTPAPTVTAAPVTQNKALPTLSDMAVSLPEPDLESNEK